MNFNHYYEIVVDLDGSVYYKVNYRIDNLLLQFSYFFLYGYFLV